MSSATSAPRTPPDPFICDPVELALAHDTLGEIPAVGERCPIINGEGARGSIKEISTSERRDTALDPLLLAAALASGPQVTRHHYHHSFFPSCDHVEAHKWKWMDGRRVISRELLRGVCPGTQSDSSSLGDHSSRSSSASPYLKPAFGVEKDALVSPLTISEDGSTDHSGVPSSPSVELNDIEDSGAIEHAVTYSTSSIGDIQVKCMVRTRVPTPHGEVFLHLYHNNRDNKEHLAIVIDPAQLDSPRPHAPYIRSKSLDSVWHDNETPMERVTRGAYVGRLNEKGFEVSAPTDSKSHFRSDSISAPLIRIHSECFTGETIGSMRCDCGEQLDEALRRIFQPSTFTDHMTGEEVTIPGRGAVIYMRQEGRGIGLLSKLRAYNLQDLGHDTVQANVLLGHGADERGYEVAAAIMHDLDLGVGNAQSGGSVRLLTNNPDKVEKLRSAGVRISEQVSMVPRSWQCQSEGVSTNDEKDIRTSLSGDAAARLRSAGATLLGAGAAHGPELEKYLRTKVLRMGHMLSLPPSDASEIDNARV